MNRTAPFVLIGLLVVGAPACSSSDDADDASTTIAAPTETPSPAADLTDTCPTETLLVARNTGTIDGELELTTEFADVTLDQSADLVFATYELPVDPQFGVSAPVGDPQAPPGGVIFQLSVSTQEEVLPLGPYPPDDSSPSRLTFTALYNGSERILPLGDHTVTLTDYTDDLVCGEITAVGDTGLQTLPVVEGTFRLTRV
jgi:hypothetical protein